MIPLILILIAVLLIFVNIKFGDKNGSMINYMRLHNDTTDLQSKQKIFREEFKASSNGYSKYEQQIGQIRKDLAESLTDLQKEIIKVNERVDNLDNRLHNKLSNKQVKNVKDNAKKYENNSIDSKDEKNKDTNSFSDILDSSVKKYTNKKDDMYDGVINDISLDSKSKRIKKLLDDGLSDDDICNKLSVGKGEILLVKGLYKK